MKIQAQALEIQKSSEKKIIWIAEEVEKLIKQKNYNKWSEQKTTRERYNIKSIMRIKVL